MAVHYTGGGGGLFDTLMRGAAMFVPGLQPLAPYIGAASALAKGDVGGAVTSAAGPMVGNMLEKTKAVAPNESLMDALRNAHRSNLPAWDTDPVTGQPNKFKHPWGWR